MLLSLLFIALLGASYTTQANIAKLGNPTPNVFKDKKQVVWEDTKHEKYEIYTEPDTYVTITRNPTITLDETKITTKNTYHYETKYLTIDQITINSYTFSYNYGADYNTDNYAYPTLTRLQPINIYRVRTFNVSAYLNDQFYRTTKIYQSFKDQMGYNYNFVNYLYGLKANETSQVIELNTTTNNQFEQYWNSTTETYEEILDYPYESVFQNNLINSYDTQAIINDFDINIYNTWTGVNFNDNTSINEVILLDWYTIEDFDPTPAMYISLNNNQALDFEGYKLWYENNKTYIGNVGQYNPSIKTNQTTKSNYTITIHFDNANVATSEVIDIGGLMWDIIGMPFTFINQAFNVTLFPGTIYQINIGTLVKGLIAILTLLFIIKIFTNGLNVIGNYTGSVEKASQNREDRKWVREERQMKREKHEKEMKE